MRGLGHFGYAQARIQARYARRVPEVVWLQLRGAQTFQRYLEAVRGTALAPWVANLSGASDVHDVEHSMRGTLYSTIRELSRWVPEPWVDAVLWVHWLVYVPALRYLLEGAPIPEWMHEGHRLRPFLQESAEDRARAIEAAGGDMLVLAWRRGEPIEDGWLRGWRALWPARRGAAGDVLDGLSEMLLQHVRQFPEGTSETAWPARRALEVRLERLFRRHAMQPVVVFVYLALVALDLERLRSELLGRMVFPMSSEP